MERFGARATPSVTIRERSLRRFMRLTPSVIAEKPLLCNELGQCDAQAMLGKYIAALQKLKSIIKPVP
jgi:hypothetical protein